MAHLRSHVFSAAFPLRFTRGCPFLFDCRLRCTCIAAGPYLDGHRSPVRLLRQRRPALRSCPVPGNQRSAGAHSQLSPSIMFSNGRCRIQFHRQGFYAAVLGREIESGASGSRFLCQYKGCLFSAREWQHFVCDKMSSAMLTRRRFE